MLRPGSGPEYEPLKTTGVVVYPKSCSLCDGILRSSGFTGTDAEGFGVGDAVTVIFVPLENMPNPPKAKNSEPSASTPSTRAAIILFLSVGDLPANGFITSYYCSVGAGICGIAFGLRKYAAISNLKLTTSPCVLPFCRAVGGRLPPNGA